MSDPPFQRVPVRTPAEAAARLRALGMLAPNADGTPWWVTDAAYVIDAALVAKTALINAASVAGLMLTTDVLITELKEETKAEVGAVS